MAWQRKIPFGYEIRGGQIRPHPQEADAVRYIFGQYLAGASFLAIAQDMAGQGIRYHSHTAEWNKNMVKRILENTRYTGADNWPRLVSDENYAAAQGQRGERNTYAPLPAVIRPIQNKMVCCLCGAKLVRGNRTHGRVYWRCQNPDCGQRVPVSDKDLAELVDAQLQKLAQAPHLLTAPEPQRAELSMDAVRLRNELTQALNRGSDSPEYITTLALAVTAQRYSQLPDPTPAHGLERLRARLEEGPIDAAALTTLLSTAVEAVRLCPGKTVELELVNGKLISEEQEESA